MEDQIDVVTDAVYRQCVIHGGIKNALRQYGATQRIAEAIEKGCTEGIMTAAGHVNNDILKDEHLDMYSGRDRLYLINPQKKDVGGIRLTMYGSSQVGGNFFTRKIEREIHDADFPCKGPTMYRMWFKINDIEMEHEEVGENLKIEMHPDRLLIENHNTVRRHLWYILCTLRKYIKEHRY